MKKILLPALCWCLLAVLPSCKPSPGSAEAYYNKTLDQIQAILEKEDVLNGMINREMQKALGDSVNANVPETADTTARSRELDAAYADFCLQIRESSGELEALGGFDGKTELFDAANALVGTYVKLSEKEYREVVDIVKIPASRYTDEDDNRFLDLTVHIDTCLQNQIDQFTLVSKAFARTYQFQLVEDQSK